MLMLQGTLSKQFLSKESPIAPSSFGKGIIFGLKENY
jgi:hypothetical protein